MPSAYEYGKNEEEKRQKEEMSKLTFISTKSLLDEIIKRFDVAVFCAVRRNIHGKGMAETLHRYEGEMLTALGLAELIARVIWDEFNEQNSEDNSE